MLKNDENNRDGYVLYHTLYSLVGWLVDSGLAAPRDSISVYIRPSPKERQKEERNDRGG